MAPTDTATDRLRVYWQPHCSSCAFVKQYLARQGVDFESINVLARDGAMDELRRMGASSVPVVARGDRFVYAQSIDDVAAFVGLTGAGAAPPPQELFERTDAILAASARFVRQFPAERLDDMMPNRPRSYRDLGYHAFRVVEVFLDAFDGKTLTYERLTSAPPDALRDGAAVAAYGDAVRSRFRDWWACWPEKRGHDPVATYYGEKPMKEVFLRTASHAGQHARQLAEILTRLGVAPRAPLPERTFRGLLVADDALDR